MEVSLDDGSDAISDGEYLRSTQWRPARPEPTERRVVFRSCFGRTRASHRRAVVGRNRRRASRGAARPARWTGFTRRGTLSTHSRLRDLPGGAVFDGATVAKRLYSDSTALPLREYRDWTVCNTVCCSFRLNLNGHVSQRRRCDEQTGGHSTIPNGRSLPLYSSAPLCGQYTARSAGWSRGGSPAVPTQAAPTIVIGAAPRCYS